MTWYIARAANNNVKSVQDEEGQPTAEMYRLIDLGYTLYSINSNGDGTFTLVPQRIATPVTESRLIGGTLEDDV